MKKPDGVECRHCRWWFWYGACCTVHADDEDLGIDHMSPDAIEFCDRFEIKVESEHGAGHYDPLPPLEVVGVAWAARFAEYAKLRETVA